MPRRPVHLRASKRAFGNLSLGHTFQAWFDANAGAAAYGTGHRKVDHTWQRLDDAGRLFGTLGRSEALLHLALDYDLLPPVLRHWLTTTSKSKPDD